MPTDSPRAVEPVYERIGAGYSTRRQPEPRWEALIRAALGHSSTVVNVGAGTGSYEPSDRLVIAVEPSPTMLAQRPAEAASVVRGTAEALPLPDRSVDVALAVLTVHHWTDAHAGLAEMMRVAGRQVVVTWDPTLALGFWLIADYLPEIAAHEADLPTLTAVTRALEDGGRTVEIVNLPVPADCRDGVMAAYWRRPEAYLDPAVRAAISSISLLDQAVVAEAMARLASDLSDDTWVRRHGSLLERDELDLGYRLVVAD
jgi:ubiquinone/menaquinone biosynthesis C-methylase UbiE